MKTGVKESSTPSFDVPTFQTTNHDSYEVAWDGNFLLEGVHFFAGVGRVVLAVLADSAHQSRQLGRDGDLQTNVITSHMDTLRLYRTKEERNRQSQSDQNKKNSSIGQITLAVYGILTAGVS